LGADDDAAKVKMNSTDDDRSRHLRRLSTNFDAKCQMLDKMLRLMRVETRFRPLASGLESMRKTRNGLAHSLCQPLIDLLRDRKTGVATLKAADKSALNWSLDTWRPGAPNDLKLSSSVQRSQHGFPLCVFTVKRSRSATAFDERSGGA
jgi:hypothetical protein